MINYLKAESLKQKHTFNNLIIWIVPIVTIIIALLLIGTGYIQTAAYNWWYILFLPFTFTYISSSIIKKEKKYNFHGLFGITINKKLLWYSKIAIATIYLFLTCLIFSILILVCGLIFNEQISIPNNLFASLLLFISFAWQIPLFMFISLKLNMFVSIILSTGCNVFIACIYAPGNYWRIPFAIPSRLMCPVINVLPNGLLMETENHLNNKAVILPGIAITVVLYFILLLLTVKIFEKQEV